MSKGQIARSEVSKRPKFSSCLPFPSAGQEVKMILTPDRPDRRQGAVRFCELKQKRKGIPEDEASEFKKVWAPFTVTFEHDHDNVPKDLNLLHNVTVIFSKLHVISEWTIKNASKDLAGDAALEAYERYSKRSLQFTCQIAPAKQTNQSKRWYGDSDKWVVKVGSRV